MDGDAQAPGTSRLMVAAQRERWARRARDEFSSFAAAVVRTPDGAPMRLPLLHLAWAAHVDHCWERGLKAGIFGAGGAGFAVTLAAWLSGRDPAARVALVSASESQARLRARAVRQVFESAAFSGVFPGRVSGRRWSSSALLASDSLDPEVEVRGVGGRPAAPQLTHVVFEGAVDAEAASTSGRRAQQVRLVDDVWLARVPASGKVLWIAPRLFAPGDASSTLRAREGWCWLTQAQGDAGWSQEVYGAGADYLDDVRARVSSMLG